MDASTYSRPLNEPQLIKDFLEIALGYEYSDKEELYNVAKLITSGEVEMTNMVPKGNTLSSFKFRNFAYQEENERWKLRKKIVEELYNNQRINDEDIKLGSGGGRPITEIQCNSEAYVIIGLPASGKSGISDKIADLTGSIVLDSDYAKRKLPEFYDYKCGASLVHLESDALIFPQEISNKPSNFTPLFVKCTDQKNNICIPKIGHNHQSILSFCKILKETFKYKVHLILVALDRRKATIRAIKRYIDTGRYVPIGLIFDGYANDPILTYYRLKNINAQSNTFETFCAISTDVKMGESPVIVDYMGDSPLLKIYNNN